MAKIRREEIVDEALRLLNEVGLDGLTTRRLAQRLHVESPTLYWHFKSKAELLNQMAATILVHYHLLAVPRHTEVWKRWLADNARSFRRALLAYRDGARLHAGTAPDAEAQERIAQKIGYLVSVGVPEHEASMALYSLGQFTLGCVLEEQARAGEPAVVPEKTPTKTPARKRFSLQVNSCMHRAETSLSEQAFEFGVQLFVDGLESHLTSTHEGSFVKGYVGTGKSLSPKATVSNGSNQTNVHALRSRRSKYQHLRLGKTPIALCILPVTGLCTKLNRTMAGMQWLPAAQELLLLQR